MPNCQQGACLRWQKSSPGSSEEYLVIYRGGLEYTEEHPVFLLAQKEEEDSELNLGDTFP